MGIPLEHPAIQQALARGLIDPAQFAPRPLPTTATTAPVAKPKRKPRAVAIPTAAGWSMTLCPACRVVTEANTHEGWRARKRRFDVQRAAVRDAWLSSPFTSVWLIDFAPLVLALTHIGPRMDSDNLAGAFKAVRDELAAIIGLDDGDDRLTWEYQQRPGTPAVEIVIRRQEEPPA